MGTVLFVHGTGVRRGSYVATLAAIQRAFDEYGIDHVINTCLWGDARAAAAVRKSIPDVTLADPAPRVLARDQEYARWDLLARDPLFEMRLLKNKPSTGPRSPATVANARALWNRIEAYESSAALLALLTR